MPSRPHPWFPVSAAWLVPAILGALQAFANHKLGNWEGDITKSVTFQFVDWLMYAALTPIVFLLARRFPLRRGTLSWRLPLHFLAALANCALWAIGGNLFRFLLYPSDRGILTLGSFVSWFFTSLPFGVAVYFAVLGIEHAIHYFFEARERETAAARLSAQLSEARLGALRMQLNPHFLFNTLNATLVLVRDRETATATAMLEQLSEVLRHVLRTDRPQEVRLAEEVEFLQRYLRIEQVRFPDRLRLVFNLDPGVLNAAVPDFILQPLVENAVRHGVANRTEGGRVALEAHREGDDLVLSVTDDGAWSTETGPRDIAGIGLSNTRERLRMLYGDRARLEISGTVTGTVAKIRIPYREVESGA